MHQPPLSIQPSLFWRRQPSTEVGASAGEACYPALPIQMLVNQGSQLNYFPKDLLYHLGAVMPKPRPVSVQ